MLQARGQTLQASLTGVGATSVPDMEMLYGLTDLAVVQGTDGPVLYAVGRAGNWLTAFDLGNGAGQAQLIDSWEIPSYYLQLQTTDLAFVHTDDGVHVLLAGLDSGDLRGRVSVGADLQSYLRYDAGSFDMGMVASLDMTGTGDVAIATLLDGSVVQLNFDDVLQTITVHTPAGAISALDAVAVTTIEAGGASYAVVAYGASDALGLLRIDGAGNYNFVQTVDMADGLWVSHPGALSAVVGADGEPYVVVAASGSNSLTVLTIQDHRLVPTGHEIDSLDTRFAGADYVEAVQIGDQTFVVAAGADQGISVFALLPGGQLLHVSTVAASLETPLNGISALDVAVEGDGARIFVATQAAPYLVEFEFSLDNPGLTRAGGDGNDSLTGGNGDDVIYGGLGADTLNGGAGNDVIVDGEQVDTLRGGAGADTFVLGVDGARDRVMDFQRGSDRLVLQSTDLVTHVSDVEIYSRTWGAELRIGDEIMLVYSADGQPLYASDFQGDALTLTTNISVHLEDYPDPGPDNGPEDGNSQFTPTEFSDGPPTALPEPSEPVIALTGGDQQLGGYADDVMNAQFAGQQIAGMGGSDQITGSAAGDILLGGNGFDTIMGAAGNDSISGGDHADSLVGGDGDDVITGGTGFDMLLGGDGHDQIWGGASPDRIYGGNGDDVIDAGSSEGYSVDGAWGEAGNDSMFGNTGFDMLSGGDGNDYLDGGDQADNLYGDAGNDTLLGGQGFDRLFGGAGNDMLYGGASGDGHFGGTGNDTIWGGAGDDRMFGGIGNDFLDGGTGTDTLYGNAGFDTLIGGEGNDLLSGNYNADRFVFADGHGHDEITDFDATNDFEVLDFRLVTSLASTTDVMEAAVQSGLDVIITTGVDSTIRLRGVDLGDLDGADFLF